MINKQYSMTQVPNYWPDIMQRIEQGYSVKLTRNNEVVWNPPKLKLGLHHPTFKKLISTRPQVFIRF